MTVAELAARTSRIVPTTANILILDIERARGWARIPFWDLGDYKNRRIHADMVEEWPRTICAAWRWYGTKKIEFVAEWGTGGRGAMLQATWDAYNKADIVVGHNLIGFDTKKLKGEWTLAGLPRPLSWQSVDTLRVAKAEFGFESNTLDSLCKRFGVISKSDRYDPLVAEAALAGDTKAQRRLKKYNMGDIEATEMFFDALRGNIPNHPHIGSVSDEKRCNQCGSEDLTLQASTYRAIQIDYALYRCNNCQGLVRGGWHSRAATTRGAR